MILYYTFSGYNKLYGTISLKTNGDSLFNSPSMFLKLIDILSSIGPSSYNTMEYPYATTNQSYISKSCSPNQESYSNTKEERSPSSSPASPESTVTPGFSSGAAPPLAHPPAHGMSSGYPMPPTGYVPNGMSSVYGYPQSYCGIYTSPSSENLHARSEHCMRTAYGWQPEAPYH